jgi:hypothetical protein
LEPVALAAVVAVVAHPLMAVILFFQALLQLVAVKEPELVIAENWLEALAALAVVVVAILMPSPLAAQETLQ